MIIRGSLTRLRIIGKRYMFCEKWMPDFVPFGQSYAGIDINKMIKPQKDMEIDPPIFNHEFLQELGENSFSRRSFLKWERIMHSHGATLQEVFTLRYFRFTRCADVVVYPDNNDDCEVISPVHQVDVVHSEAGQQA